MTLLIHHTHWIEESPFCAIRNRSIFHFKSFYFLLIETLKIKVQSLIMLYTFLFVCFPVPLSAESKMGNRPPTYYLVPCRGNQHMAQFLFLAMHLNLFRAPIWREKWRAGVYKYKKKEEGWVFPLVLKTFFILVMKIQNSVINDWLNRVSF